MYLILQNYTLPPPFTNENINTNYGTVDNRFSHIYASHVNIVLTSTIRQLRTGFVFCAIIYKTDELYTLYSNTCI